MGHWKTLAALFALSLTWPALGSISLCTGGQLYATTQHGSPKAYFYLPLDPSLNAAAATSIVLTGRQVLIDIALGPGGAPPLLNPNCFFINSELPGGFEPGDYLVRWTVRRLTYCASGTCEAETATFSLTLTVAEPLSCYSSYGAWFDVVPWPPIGGTTIKALHASTNVIPYVVSVPTVTITGRTIRIHQAGTYSGPPPPPTIYCISTSANLGVLASGQYDVTWELATGSGLETHQYSLDVLDAASIPALQWPILVGLVAALAIVSVRALQG
ncbi:MAG: hypothetical protein QOC81_585 [Thermoanaerobaculia bacterium]|nr:hypothetical protein [Thermoanaerobaculia bacterium]